MNNRKYLSEKKDKNAVDAIIKVNNETDFAKREAVYANNREALQHQIRLVSVCI